MNGDQTGWFLGWIGLAVAVVVLSDYPTTAPLVRYTLLAVIAYVLLANAERFGPPIARWVVSLSTPASRPAVGRIGPAREFA